MKSRFRDPQAVEHCDYGSSVFGRSSKMWCIKLQTSAHLFSELYVCYTFDLLSTEVDQSLPPQTRSFFWKRMGNSEIWSLHELLVTPLLFCQRLCSTDSVPHPSPHRVFKSLLEINCRIITAALGSRSNLESAKSSALQDINYHFWSVAMKNMKATASWKSI